MAAFTWSLRTWIDRPLWNETMWNKACPSWHGAKAGCTLDKLLGHHWFDIKRQPNTHIHTGNLNFPFNPAHQTFIQFGHKVNGLHWINRNHTYIPMGFYIIKDGCGISSPYFLPTFAVLQLLQAELEFFYWPLDGAHRQCLKAKTFSH